MGVLGVGTFIVGLLFVITSAVWFLSYSCGSPAKAIWRVVSTGILVIVAVILYFAPHANRFEDSSFEPAVSSSAWSILCHFHANSMHFLQVYDYSIIPRITISLIMIIFGGVAARFLYDLLAESHEVTKWHPCLCVIATGCMSNPYTHNSCRRWIRSSLCCGRTECCGRGVCSFRLAEAGRCGARMCALVLCVL